ncbi:ABC transporter ATP-binding protein [Listeria monocytogenes]|uniref:ABC transporter ATP-binding protein n=1 Tax=Listeria monocytogenes TaxID=1639 RepID=UPI000854A4A6|nr:ABC transporter ATP-binding protein [Listeria monocytogenes]EAD2806900.1 ABC transporter ATP-binding protein [Listeria monocytogenes]EAD8612594.1 ABC transporter ATP-binding protein [Listeria monocytogenes]EAD9074474.1 ABC transporter ATP-binding protein [Listeria monocytogenes]EAD9143637.1 ABC transporter ATP-binding protein [Listeria monocytogenes]EAD9909209.1 ABC transporter ATP-binding protein [Listeria monocytogenes]
MSLINCKNLQKSFLDGKKNIQVLKQVNLELQEGEFVSIVGASGSGKSTLLHILGLLDTFDTGSYQFQGQGMDELTDRKRALFRNQNIGFILQNIGLILDYTVKENLQLPLKYAREKNKDSEKIIYWLERFGLSSKLEEECVFLSGGEQQRVAIARALMNNPTLILADEPTGSLDHDNSIIVMETFKKLNQEGRTILMVTHDLELANQYSEKIVHLKDGEIISV